MDDLYALNITDALNALRGKKITPQDLAGACLRQIERLNPTLCAFITVNELESALNHRPAENVPAILANALRGVPIAVKDLFNTAGIRTTIGSKFFMEHIPEEDAFVVEKLKYAGATIMGKTNTHEIALGVTGDNPHFGTARNPWNSDRIPGGSSSGSAIAVATGMSLGASAPIPAARSASLPRCVESLASNPPMDASARAVSSRSPGISTMLDL